MNYYISDLHLFHEAAIRFDDRPFRDLEEMHTEIVKRWNEKVNNGDTVYILGDVSMRGKNENLIALGGNPEGKKGPDPWHTMTCPTSDTDAFFGSL